MNRIKMPTVLDPNSIASLTTAITSSISDDSIRVIVLEGDAKTFCLGMSFDYLVDHANEPVDTIIDSFTTLLKLISDSPKPIIAYVQAKALAGGVGIAAACDVIIADPQASFGFSEPLFGLLPGIVMPFLLQRVSSQKARSLILSASSISAQRAFDIGLVDHIATAESLNSIMNRMIRQLSRVNGHIISSLKNTISSMSILERDAAIEHGCKLLKQSLTDQTVMDSIHNFISHGTLAWGEQCN